GGTGVGEVGTRGLRRGVARRSHHRRGRDRAATSDVAIEAQERDRMSSDKVAIRVSGVSHAFGEVGDVRHVQALRDSSLEVTRGELLCLIGPSGCGKSTLLNVIGGLLTPTTGTVEVAGKPVRGPMPHDIAFVFQEHALFPWNTVLE